MNGIVGYSKSGRAVYDNTQTVVLMLALSENGTILVVRRNNKPGVGLIGLPGGYQEYGETWQECARRETLEETGYLFGDVKIIGEPVTDEYHNNLIFCTPKKLIFPGPPGLDWVKPAEVQEVLFVGNVFTHRWAFPRHLIAAHEFLKETVK